MRAPARAAGPEIGVADDRVLMAGGAEADRVVAEWRANGVDVVRIFAQSTRIERWGWSELDASVARVRGAGMEPILTVVGPRVRPARRRSRRSRARWRRATAGRSIAHRLERANLPGWLLPQATCSHGRCSPVAPHLYRGLVRAARPAIHAADPGAQVLIGAMSSRGQDLRKTDVTERPMVFLRALGCVDARWRRLRTGYCKDFKPATADGFAFHPHGTLNSPDRPYPNADDVNLASLGRLEGALDRLQRGGRLLATTPRLGLYLDEYGYQTRPPDKTAGVSLATQDRWLQRAAYRAWRDPRVKLLVQYQWLDEPVRPPFSGWQSGLRFVNGKPKPALAHFDTPMALDAARSRLWGRRGRAARRRCGSSGGCAAREVRPLATVQTNARGYWTLKRRLTRGARYRFRTALATSASFRRLGACRGKLKAAFGGLVEAPWCCGGALAGPLPSPPFAGAQHGFGFLEPFALKLQQLLCIAVVDGEEVRAVGQVRRAILAGLDAGQRGLQVGAHRLEAFEHRGGVDEVGGGQADHRLVLDSRQRRGRADPVRVRPPPFSARRPPSAPAPRRSWPRPAPPPPPPR